LRFIVPAVLHPHLFGLSPGLPPPPVQRSLTLIAKVIQSLANLNANVKKEEFMGGIQDFLADKRNEMTAYLQVVSTPTDSYGSKHENPDDRRDRLNVVNSLRQRAATMAVLDREAIPVLPHLLDVPRHLAIITSAVIRHSRDFYSKAKSTEEQGEGPLVEICSRCFEVEEQALHRVSQLATRISSDRRRASLSVSTFNSAAFGSSPSASANGQRRKKSGRPSTAPSPSDNDASRRHLFPEEFSSPRFFNRQAPARPKRGSGSQADSQRPSHLKSPSTDSVPINAARSSQRDTRPTAVIPDGSDDAGKRKKNFIPGIRGILRR